MTQHMLKCHPEDFEALKNGTKNFECHYNDRNFNIFDVLLLNKKKQHQSLFSTKVNIVKEK
ncbi:DUF3850 domain-containing protein [Streptococcus hyointestinalis]